MSRIESVVMLCKIQLHQLAERQERLLQEIEDGQIQMEYIELLMKEIKKINTIEYAQLDKSFIDTPNPSEQP